MNSGSEMVEAKHVSGKNMFWSTLTAKSRGGKFFEFLHYPFEGRAKVLFKDLNPGIAMAIVHFKFSRKLYFCFESVIRQKFNFSAFSEMAQNF